jgi:hypothetical protein
MNNLPTPLIAACSFCAAVRPGALVSASQHHALVGRAAAWSGSGYDLALHQSQLKYIAK